MMLQPIHNQRLLPAQVQQTVLPAVTVDTTEIHKLINQMYNKTIIMPATQTFEETHYIQTPQGLVKQSEPINPSSSIVSTQPVAALPQQQLVISQAQKIVPQPQPQVLISQPQVLIPQTQAIIPQPQAITPQAQVVVPQPQVIVPQVVPQMQAISIQPISGLVINQRSSLIQPVVPLVQSVLVNPAPQLMARPLISQSILTQPLSASYNPSMVMNVI